MVKSGKLLDAYLLRTWGKIEEYLKSFSKSRKVMFLLSSLLFLSEQPYSANYSTQCLTFMLTAYSNTVVLHVCVKFSSLTLLSSTFNCWSISLINLILFQKVWVHCITWNYIPGIRLHNLNSIKSFKWLTHLRVKGIRKY